jgi:hypothetical protein
MYSNGLPRLALWHSSELFKPTSDDFLIIRKQSSGDCQAEPRVSMMTEEAYLGTVLLLPSLILSREISSSRFDEDGLAIKRRWFMIGPCGDCTTSKTSVSPSYYILMSSLPPLLTSLILYISSY